MEAKGEAMFPRLKWQGRTNHLTSRAQRPHIPTALPLVQGGLFQAPLISGAGVFTRESELLLRLSAAIWPGAVRRGKLMQSGVISSGEQSLLYVMSQRGERQEVRKRLFSSVSQDGLVTLRRACLRHGCLSPVAVRQTWTHVAIP